MVLSSFKCPHAAALKQSGSKVSTRVILSIRMQGETSTGRSHCLNNSNLVCIDALRESQDGRVWKDRMIANSRRRSDLLGSMRENDHIEYYSSPTHRRRRSRSRESFQNFSQPPALTAPDLVVTKIIEWGRFLRLNAPRDNCCNQPAVTLETCGCRGGYTRRNAPRTVAIYLR